MQREPAIPRAQAVDNVTKGEKKKAVKQKIEMRGTTTRPTYRDRLADKAVRNGRS
jgi:hypothetical protein